MSTNRNINTHFAHQIAIHILSSPSFLFLLSSSFIVNTAQFCSPQPLLSQQGNVESRKILRFQFSIYTKNPLESENGIVFDFHQIVCIHTVHELSLSTYINYTREISKAKIRHRVYRFVYIKCVKD